MKKVLMVVALLLLATPVFAADVTITATKVGSPVGSPNSLQQVRIGYTGAAEANSIRAFALVLTVDSGCNIDNICDFNRGESLTPGGGYGIFPGKVRQYINAASPNWADTNYNPIAPSGDPNGTGGNDNPRMVVELGTLYKDANAPGTSGTLFSVDVNLENNGGSKDCNLCIAVDATRGGVVKNDAAGATVTLPSCVLIQYSVGVTVPNVLTMNRVAARTAITALGLTVTEANVAPTAAGQLRTIIAQSPTGGTVVAPGSNVNISAVSYPIKDAAPSSLYANWVTLGRPQCWAYPRQCHGDADGKKQLSYWTASNDLTILRGAYNKVITAMPTGGICVDATHSKQLSYWVGSNDLTILRAYYNKVKAINTVCGLGGVADANYWYLCLPSGSACPSGVTCAPVTICPNTP